MATELELEKTFLVSELPPQINGAQHERIEDGFITPYQNQPVLRLRHRGNKFEITKKAALDQNDASAHHEHTIDLTEQEYNALLSSFTLKIRKIRYYVSVYGKQAEIDIFGGDLSGLITVDFEFKTPEEMQSFQPPEFCLRDVTQEQVGSAGKMAGLTYANVQSDLETFGYQPIYFQEGQSVV
jgi:CYTH domain-containing protein